MRGCATLTLLLLLGCTRSFTPPGAEAARVTGLTLASGATLSRDQAVFAGETLRIEGAGLGSVQAVRFGAASAPPSPSADGLEVVVPSPPVGSEGQPAQVLLETDRGGVPAGELRIYPVPAVQQVQPGPGASAVVAGAQAYLFGTGFSPAEETRVTIVGEAGEVPAPVLSATPSQLLVTVPLGAPNGSRTLMVRTVPKNAGRPDADFAPLTAHAAAVIWKPIPPFQVVPAAALPGEVVRLLTPDPAAEDWFDHPLAIAAGAPDAGAVAVGSTGGTNTGATGGSGGSTGTSGGSGGSTGGGSPFGTGGLGDADAGVSGLNNDYPLDPTGNPLWAPPPPAPPAPISEALASARLKVLVDATEASERLRVRSDDHSFVVHVPEVSPGAHQLAVTDPAGTSPSAPLTVLAGHLTDPALYCRPAGGALPADGLVPRALRSRASAGSVVLWGQTDGGPLEVAEVHPGGSLGPTRSLDVGPLTDLRVVGAGRQALFVRGHALQDGVAAYDLDDDEGRPELGAPLDAPALAAVEPDLESPFAWALTSPDDVGPLRGAPQVVAFGRAGGGAIGLGPALPQALGCTVLAGGLFKARVTPTQASSLLRAELALRCGASGDLTLAVTPLLPDAPGDFDPGLDATSTAGFDAVQPGPTSVALGPNLLLAWGTRAAVLEAGSHDATLLTEAPATVTAGAVSPDGRQVALAGRDPGGPPLLAFFDRRPGGGWALAGSFALDSGLTPRALTYDRSGGQVVLLWRDAAARDSYCVAH